MRCYNEILARQFVCRPFFFFFLSSALEGRSLDDLIEYELDEDDEDFLYALNSVLKLKDSIRKTVMTEDDLEAVLTYFEIESFYQVT